MGKNLTTLLGKQKEFQEFLCNEEIKDNPEKMQYHLACATVEIAEVLTCDERWKNWKTHPNEVDKEHKLEEFADVFLFLFNALIFSGFTGDEIYDKIEEKIQINYRRQKEGY